MDAHLTNGEAEVLSSHTDPPQQSAALLFHPALLTDAVIAVPKPALAYHLCHILFL